MTRSEYYYDTPSEQPTRWFRAVALFFTVFIALVGVWAASPLAISRLNLNLTRAATPTVAPAPPVATAISPVATPALPAAAPEPAAAPQPLVAQAPSPRQLGDEPQAPSARTVAAAPTTALVSPFTELPTGWTAPPPAMIEGTPFPPMAPTALSLASATSEPVPLAEEDASALQPGEILANVPLPRKRPTLVAGIPLPRARPPLPSDSASSAQPQPDDSSTWRDRL
jgi:hypothetical protein